MIESGGNAVGEHPGIRTIAPPVYGLASREPE